MEILSAEDRPDGPFNQRHAGNASFIAGILVLEFWHTGARLGFREIGV